MTGTTAVRNLIREGKIHQIPGTMQVSQKDGMQTMDMALTNLVSRGLVTREEAQSKSMNPNLFGAAPRSGRDGDLSEGVERFDGDMRWIFRSFFQSHGRDRGVGSLSYGRKAAHVSHRREDTRGRRSCLLLRKSFGISPTAIMNEKQQQDFDETIGNEHGHVLPGVARFRVNIFRQRGSVGMVIRRIKAEVMSLDELGLPAILKDIAMTKRGLVLVVGATGSGKSTSLAAMIDHRNSSEAGHIITIEDPIEFVHRHKQSIVTQREVGFDTHSFQSALKNTLRQAPDVILIGEIRDTETMEAAITFAETGHLCLGTLHSNNANQAIERIMNFFPVRAARADLFATFSESASDCVATADSVRRRQSGWRRWKS